MSETVVPALEFSRLPLSRQSLTGRLIERRWTFLIVFLLVSVGAAGVFTLLPASYRATSTIIVAVQETGTSESSAAWVEKLGDPADLESQLLLIRSPRLLRELLSDPVVMAALREDCEATANQSGIYALQRYIHAPKSCDETLSDSGNAVSWIQDHLIVGSMGRSRVIAVVYQSPSPEAARTMANALVAVSLEDGRKQKLNSREAAVAWVHQQLTQLSEELHRQDVDLQVYRRDHGLVRGQMAPISSESLTATALLLAKAQASKAEALARILEVSSAGNPSVRQSSRPVLESRTISDLKAQLVSVSAQLAGRSASFVPDSPVLAPLR